MIKNTTHVFYDTRKTLMTSYRQCVCLNFCCNTIFITEVKYNVIQYSKYILNQNLRTS